jgi:outer membrane protein TolC
MQDWYEALRAQAALQLWQQQHALLTQLQSVAARRVRAGDAAALERMQADTELGRAAVQLEQARLLLRQALAQLTANYPALPLPTLPELAQLPEPPALPAGHLAQRAAITQDNHELELAEEESTWFRLKAERAASERMPDPTLTLRSTRERGGQERTLGLMLSIALPGGARTAEQGAAVVRAEMARERVSQVRTKVALAAEKVVSEQEAAFTMWAQLRELAAQQARQAELMDKAYQAGEGSISDVLQSRRLAQDAALAALAGRIQALAAQARVQLDAHALWSID